MRFWLDHRPVGAFSFFLQDRYIQISPKLFQRGSAGCRLVIDGNIAILLYHAIPWKIWTVWDSEHLRTSQGISWRCDIYGGFSVFFPQGTMINSTATANLWAHGLHIKRQDRWQGTVSRNRYWEMLEIFGLYCDSRVFLWFSNRSRWNFDIKLSRQLR